MSTKDMFPVEIEYLDQFYKDIKRLVKKYRKIRKDLEPLLDAISIGKTPGDQIPGSNFIVYKVRVKNSDNNKGKSGGYRVIYRMVHSQLCHLVTIYSKSEQPDIRPEEIDSIIAETLEELNLEEAVEEELEENLESEE